MGHHRKALRTSAVGGRRLGDADRRQQPRARPRRPGGDRHPVRRHRRGRRHGPRRRTSSPPPAPTAPAATRCSCCRRAGACPQVEYLAQARRLADAGYVVRLLQRARLLAVRRRDRGGGPARRRRRVQGHRLGARQHPGRPAREVGMAGVSYGAGISLLAAAHDQRVKAVAALSGWADLVGSIYCGRTQHVQAAALLDGASLAHRPPQRRSPADLRRLLRLRPGQGTRAHRLGQEALRRRTYVDAINANGTAVMLANAWGDTIFPPNQYADFYEKLTGPKRLELRPGDHATAEITGLFGLPNDVWTDTRALVRPLPQGRGQRRRPRAARAAQVPFHAARYEGYPDWKSVGATRPEDRPRRARSTIHTERRLRRRRRRRLALRRPRPGGPDCRRPCRDPPAAPPLGRRMAVGAVRGAAAGARHRRVHTTVTRTKESGTLVAYLYDVGPLGLGKLVTNAPYTFHGRDARASRSASTWSCSPRPTTSRRATGWPWSSTRSTRSTSSTTRPARS